MAGCPWPVKTRIIQALLMEPIHPDIRHAHTLPAEFYRSAAVFEEVKEKIFARTWQYVADASVMSEEGYYFPFTLLPGVLDEPLILTRDAAGILRCLSNVCTHRSKVIVEKPGKGRTLRCGYHGRCFHLDGRFKSMPGFEEAAGFPAPEDDLVQVRLRDWLELLFIALEPAADLATILRPVTERVGWLPMDTLVYKPELSRDYQVQANWALYCDNYLEGFHVPFVHPGLNAALDFQNYDYELFDYCNLQLGVAKEGDPCFELPLDSPDYGRQIYAYYFWVFPNLMLNFYPWGLSMNLVEPLSHRETRIRFRTYQFEGTPFDWTLNQIHQTEMEDEAVVESVQKGVQSRYFRRGRFSPSMEKCVHHFHELVAKFMNGQEQNAEL